MGGGNDSFRVRLQQERSRTVQRALHKQEEQQRKLDDYQAKEEARLAPLRALAAMRFQGGGGIAPQPPPPS